MNTINTKTYKAVLETHVPGMCLCKI